MPPRLEDEWSDSEDEDLAEVETAVLLGIPDGEIIEPFDLLDPSVSRIGGLPLLPYSSSHCKSCSQPMPLLVQLWCPFEGSAMDRALYVWGCDRTECQRKAGSIRVWRGLKYNTRYATKLAQKKRREAENLARKEAEAALEADQKRKQAVNPFSNTAATQVHFGLGSQLFGGDDISLGAVGDNHVHSESDDSSSEDTIAHMAKQLETTSLQSPAVTVPWSSSPIYKPIYLSTISEYIPLPPKSKKRSDNLLEEDVEDKNASTDWNLEGWEKAADVDPVFERFVRRVSSESDQCVRYDLKGTPLPFDSRDALYDLLFPPPPLPPFNTKPGFETPAIQRRTFDQGALDKCGACGGLRVFECQLMPNLINVMRKVGEHKSQDGERDRRCEEPQVQQSDGTQPPHKMMKEGMEWGSCFIFSCVDDCCAEQAEAWQEELVLVQWDD